MSPEQQQRLIVKSIAQFLERAHLAFEQLPTRQKPSTRYMTIVALRNHLLSEIGPNARFRLIDETAITEE